MKSGLHLNAIHLSNNTTFVALHTIMEEKISLIINRSEITAGTRGASLGPDAIKAAARSLGSEFFNKFRQIEIKDENYLLDQQSKYTYAKRIDGLVLIYERISNAVIVELKEGRIPIVLAADHGSAGGTMAGIATAEPDSKLGVIWIDAHADAHSPYTTPSGNIHGMPISTALNFDNISCGDNVLDDETKALWEQLKNTGKPGPKIEAEHLVYIGVRDTEKEEDHLIKELNIRNYTVEELRNKGVENVVAQTLEKLKECDMIYVSFDVDSMDPEMTSYGTGTPVKNGITPEEAAGLLEGFASDKKVKCIEFVEVNPCLDEKKNKMAEQTFALIERTVNAIKNRA